MNKNKTKNIICINLKFVILFIILTIFTSCSLKNSLYAAKLVSNYNEDTLVDDMDTITFGSYPQNDITGLKKEPIEWIVLDRVDDKLLLLSKYILDCKCYNNESEPITWRSCELRSWLNHEFYYQAFNSNEQNKIIKEYIKNNDNIDFDTDGGYDTKDKVFCLSIEETRKYFGNGIKNPFGYDLGKNVITYGTNYAKAVDNYSYKLFISDETEWEGNSNYWLRSPGVNELMASMIFESGFLSTNGVDVDRCFVGVRPAIWVQY